LNGLERRGEGGVTDREAALGEAWSALGGDPSRRELHVSSGRPILTGPLPVGDLAIACVGATLLAAAELAEARGVTRPAVAVDAAHVEAAFTSERHALLDGRPLGIGFDPLSTWMRTAGGWLRTHANYPHHRAALAAAAGAGLDVEAVRKAVAGRGGEELEDAIFAAGGCAAVLRDQAAWQEHPQGRVPGELGLLDIAAGGGGAPPLPDLVPGAPPASGLRVLDLTRVIAGPVGTRMLAALGAGVLRVDPPSVPEIAAQAIDTGPGKRSAHLDLRTDAGRRTFGRLLGEADVLVQGYRPGALEALGFGMADLARRHPHLVTVSLSAWGEDGPWGGRRGFDSLVQAASGIAVACTPEAAARPGALPAQALDHGTGYLIAAAALRGLAERARSRPPLHARLALARTARWLLDLPRAPAAVTPPADPAPFLVDLPSPLGRVTLVAPPGTLDGRPLAWTRGPVPPGSDPPAW
jgi:hypothetical protein